MSLSRLLNPQTVAVIGGKEAQRVVEQCNKIGFGGTIWPVHPNKSDVRGHPCYASVDDLPEAPDVAYIAVNRERSIDVVTALSERGAGGAVCYAAGFAEADGEKAGSGDLQQRLIEAAGDMPVIGPNCYGFINALERVALWPDQHGMVACDSGVAVVMQSSNVAINITMQKRGLPIAYMMTAGNQAQQGISVLGLALLEDERVTALGLHIEGLDDLKAFEALAFRARTLNKPIVAIKVGKSEQAQVAAMTHTASLAGGDTAHDALFRRLGIARVQTLESFIETLKLLHMGGPLAGNEILSLSCSGGEASLMADAAEGRNLVYRPYAKAEAAELKEILGDIVTVANPLDYNTFIWGDWPGMTRMFEVALAPGFNLSMLVMDFPRNDRCDPYDWKASTDTFIAAVKQTGARAAVVSGFPETMPEDVAADLLSKDIAPLCGLENAVLAAEAAAMIGRVWATEAALPLLSPPNSVSDQSRNDNCRFEFVKLDEHQSKTELARFGLALPNNYVVRNEADIRDALAKVYQPFALKALGVAHKTEAGAVHLNLRTPKDVTTAMQSMAKLSKTFLLEEMAPAPIAELIVGITRDPVCGLVLTIGAGGVLTELLNDSASLLLPATENDIRTALAGLKISKLLEGYRGVEAPDMDALIANIMSITDYAVANADTLEELDVNPLFVMEAGCVAVDALIVKRKTS